MGRLGKLAGKSIRVGTMAAVVGGFWAGALHSNAHGDAGRMGENAVGDVGEYAVPTAVGGVEFSGSAILGIGRAAINHFSSHSNSPGSTAPSTPSGNGNTLPTPYSGEGWIEFLEKGLGHTAAEASACYSAKDLAHKTLHPRPTADPC